MVASEAQLERIRNGEESERGAGACKLEITAQFWPTPNATDHKGSTRPGQRRGQLSEATEVLWMTPQVADMKATPRPPRRKVDRQNRGETPGSYRSDLSDQVSLWATPVATDSQRGSVMPEKSRRRERGKPKILNYDAAEFVDRLWATPTAHERSFDPRQVDHGIQLANQVNLWSTPRASDGEKGGPNQSFGAGGTPLPAQAASFPSSLPAPETSTPGAKSSRDARTLNPQFVEWLMGWPINWTNPPLPDGRSE